MDANPQADEAAVSAEIERGVAALASLRKHPLDLITVRSLGPDDDAVLLARNISKLSPFVSTQLEAAAVKVLSEVPGEDGLSWARQDPGFPDAGLCRAGVQTGHGMEAKAWFAHSTEITGRFRASQTMLIGKRVYVVIVAWMLDRVIYGQPMILDIGIFDAGSVAERRDAHYHRPIDYLVMEPQDTSDRGRQLQQKNVAGYKCQSRDPSRLHSARLMLGDRTWEPPFSETSRVISKQLLNMLDYREDTNFAKIDRIKHPEIVKFKATVLGMSHLGRTVEEWTSVLNGLASEVDLVREHALGVVTSELYES